jgi:hypothetical protein
MHSSWKQFSLCILFVCAPPIAFAQTNNLCVNVQLAANLCSSTAMNGNCTLIIDRLNPTTPPLINAKRGSIITVTVLNPSPFEDLTLDLSSVTAQVPADQFSTAFSAISAIAGKITVIGVSSPLRLMAVHPGITEISKNQKNLLDALQAPLAKAKDSLFQIKAAMQPPPGDVCFGTADHAQAWLDTIHWKTKVEDGLNWQIIMPDGTAKGETKTASKLILTFDGQIAALGTNDATPDEIAQLKNYQKTLTDAVTTLDKLALLRKVIHDLPDKGKAPGNKLIDLQSTGNGRKAVLIDQNDQNEVWTLDYANILSANVKSATTDPPTYPDQTSLSNLSTLPAAKQPLVKITILYQTPPHIEVSTGLLVPMQPYHSYATAAVASGGVVTGNIVQESLIYTVVPVAQVNIVAKDWVMRQQRAAIFGTVAVGYNPATSAVEFGVGPSFSWRSIVLSGLVDIGRDTQLAGGFTVNEVLPVSNPPKPLTNTAWGVKPAAGISIRIPLGGSSSGSK